MLRALLPLVLLLAACGNPEGVKRAADAQLPPSDEVFQSVPPGASPDELLATIDQGLRTEGKGPDMVRFVVLQYADRHGPAVRDEAFHVLAGAGVRLPAGALRVRRQWLASGMVDGHNEQLQTMGLSVAVERGAPVPAPQATAESVADFCEALAQRVPIHPDCVVAMEEIPYTNRHSADAAERALAAVTRPRIPVPAADRHITIVTAERRIPVACEVRDTTAGRSVGMMMRRRFDGQDRGMLFVYPHRMRQLFYMRNVFIPIDLAYLLRGRIEQIEAMAPQAGDPGPFRYYESDAHVRFVLEMPAGWFARNGVRVGDAVELE